MQTQYDERVSDSQQVVQQPFSPWETARIKLQLASHLAAHRQQLYVLVSEQLQVLERCVVLDRYQAEEMHAGALPSRCKEELLGTATRRGLTKEQARRAAGTG